MWTLFKDAFYSADEILNFEKYLNTDCVGNPIGFIKG